MAAGRLGAAGDRRVRAGPPARQRPSALLVGALLYAGMYAQPDLTVMYAAIAAGYTAWGALYLWVRRARPSAVRTIRAAELPIERI